MKHPWDDSYQDGHVNPEIYFEAIGDSTSPKALDRLAHHINPIIKKLVAGNKKTSINTLLHLVGDKSRNVREEAVRQIMVCYQFSRKDVTQKDLIKCTQAITNDNFDLINAIEHLRKSRDQNKKNHLK